MISEGWQHALSCAIRFDNHFTGEPVDAELPVRLDESFTRPVAAPNGRHRQADGSYRFIDLDAGSHRVRWLPALERTFRGWVSWEADLQVLLPVSDPAELITRDLWPAATAAVAPGVTAIRGRLTGANTAGWRVRIANATFPSTHFTRSDEVGDFLYLLPGPIETNTAGRIELDIEVADGARAVVGGEFVPDGSGTPFGGGSFAVVPGRTSRVLFRIT